MNIDEIRKQKDILYSKIKAATKEFESAAGTVRYTVRLPDGGYGIPHDVYIDVEVYNKESNTTTIIH